MKKILFLVLAFLLLCNPCLAGTDQANWTGASIDNDGDATFKSVTTTTGAAREVNLPLINFYKDQGNATIAATDTGTPVFTLSATAPYIKWTFGEGNAWHYTVASPPFPNSTPIFTSFRVPPDYRTGPSFVLTCKNSVAATPLYPTPQYVDWDIVVYKNDVAETSYEQYDNTPVGVYGSETGTANTTDGGFANATIDQITLTYSTGSDISAGDMILVRFWPARFEPAALGYGEGTGWDATSDLYLYNAVFRYTSQW